MEIMIWDVSNQFGISKGIVHLFTYQMVLALYSLDVHIITWSTIEEK